MNARTRQAGAWRSQGWRLVGIALLFLAGCGKPAPADPLVNGRLLSEWLAICEPGAPNRVYVTVAVRKCGTNAIPLLLDYFERDDNSLEHVRKYYTHGITAYEQNRFAENGFRALAEIGAPALPRLKVIAAKSEWPISEHASNSIAYIEMGLAAVTNNGNSNGRAGP